MNARTPRETLRAERTSFMWLRASDVADGATHEIMILGTRYGGTYEGAPWVAWIGNPEWLDDSHAGDNACAEFWADYAGAPIGRGSTPDTALADLQCICKAGRDAFKPRDFE